MLSQREAWEAEVEESLQVWRQSGLHSEFRDSLDYSDWLCSPKPPKAKLPNNQNKLTKKRKEKKESVVNAHLGVYLEDLSSQHMGRGTWYVAEI